MTAWMSDQAVEAEEPRHALIGEVPIFFIPSVRSAQQGRNGGFDRRRAPTLVIRSQESADVEERLQRRPGGERDRLGQRCVPMWCHRANKPEVALWFHSGAGTTHEAGWGDVKPGRADAATVPADP